MDVERTINFIMDSQAKAEIRQAKADERLARAEARVTATEKRLDKRMDAIAKLIQQGMRLLVTQKADTDRRIKELAEAQKDTHKTLKAFIESLQKGRNGH